MLLTTPYIFYVEVRTLRLKDCWSMMMCNAREGVVASVMVHAAMLCYRRGGEMDAHVQ